MYQALFICANQKFAYIQQRQYITKWSFSACIGRLKHNIQGQIYIAQSS